MKTLIFSLCVMFGVSGQAISILSVTYGGTGCPANSLEASTNSDGTVVLEPAEFSVSIPSSKFDRKACDIAIALEVPLGYAVAFNSATMAGAVELTEQMNTVLSSEAFFAGQRGTAVTQTINGPSSMRFLKEIKPSIAWSNCNASVILRLHTAVVLQSKTANNDDALVSVEQITIAPPLLKKCAGIE